jgi:hypothetical protein
MRRGIRLPSEVVVVESKFFMTRLHGDKNRPYRSEDRFLVHQCSIRGYRRRRYRNPPLPREALERGMGVAQLDMVSLNLI